MFSLHHVLIPVPLRVENQQDMNIAQVVRELLPVLPGISSTVLPEVANRLTSRILARVIRDTFL